MTQKFDKDSQQAPRRQIRDDVGTAVLTYDRQCYNTGRLTPMGQVETMVRCHRNFSSIGTELEMDLEK